MLQGLKSISLNLFLLFLFYVALYFIIGYPKLKKVILHEIQRSEVYMMCFGIIRNYMQRKAKGKWMRWIYEVMFGRNDKGE